jgi:hypothetical protein
MRVLMKVSTPVESGNEGVKTGALPKLMMTFMETNKPESAVFGFDHGRRTAYFVLDLKDNASMVSLCEPFLMGFNATVDVIPVMNAADLKAGLDKLPK